MLKTSMNIGFKARPCKNIRAYYLYSDETKTSMLSQIGNRCAVKDLSKLSDVPGDIAPTSILFEWDLGVEISVDEEAMFGEISQLLAIYDKGRLDRGVKGFNLKPLFAFAERYGMIFGNDADPFKSISLESIRVQMMSFCLINWIINPPRPLYKKMVLWMHRSFRSAANHYRSEGVKLKNPHFINTSGGFTVGEPDKRHPLYFQMPATREMLKRLEFESEGVKEGDSVHPDFINTLRSYALECILNYVGSREMKYAVRMGDKTIDYAAFICSPVAYYLLKLKQPDTEQRERKLARDRERARRTDLRLIKFFRNWKGGPNRAQRITEQQFEQARALAEELREEPYEEAKRQIIKRIMGGVKP